MMNLGYNNAFTAWNPYNNTTPTVAPQSPSLLTTLAPTPEDTANGDTVTFGGAGTQDAGLMPSPWKMKAAFAANDIVFSNPVQPPAYNPNAASNDTKYLWTPPAKPAFVNGQSPFPQPVSTSSPSTNDMVFNNCGPLPQPAYNPNAASNDTAYLWNPPTPGIPASWAQ